ncbi:SRPBCC family protein [Sphaerisporangium aureirubrum]|uniref:SRPBCC family protein n=1 Tax=Sphaerisporangium aureirubrum TaxID=1544736 RepID=A0ABW1NII6_9ACTN
MGKVGVRARVRLDAREALRRLADGGWCETLPREVGTVRIEREAVAGHGERRVSEWALPFRSGTVRWRQIEEVFPERPGIVFEQEDGDLARLSGAWRFQPEPPGPGGGDTCQVTFELRFDLGVPLWNRVIDPLLARALAAAAEAVIVTALGEAELSREPSEAADAERLVTAVSA